MKKTVNGQGLTPFDLLILVIVLVPLFLSNGIKSNASKVLIKTPKWTKEYALKSDTAVVINSYYGKMIVRIKDKNVWVEETHCPLKICQKTGRISKPGQNIVCVPNRVFIKIEGGESDYDAYSR